MKKTSLIVLSALAAVTAVAGPVLAQPYGPPPGMERPGGWDLERRIHWTQDRIVRGRDDGSLDRREFDRVQGELDRIRHERDEAFRRDGGRLEPRVRDDLLARLDHVNDQIHWMRDAGEHRPW